MCSSFHRCSGLFGTTEAEQLLRCVTRVGHRGAVALRTDAVLPVPVQLVPGWTGTLVASQRVDAAVLAASAVYAALIDVWNNVLAQRHLARTHNYSSAQLVRNMKVDILKTKDKVITSQRKLK